MLRLSQSRQQKTQQIFAVDSAGAALFLAQTEKEQGHNHLPGVWCDNEYHADTHSQTAGGFLTLPIAETSSSASKSYFL